jgi:hypothetical protein
MSASTITPFPVAGLQETSGGSAQLFSAPGTVLTGPGAITNIACARGTFQIFDSVGPPVGKTPLTSVAANGPYSAAASIAFTNGLWMNAQGPNSNIQIGID